ESHREISLATRDVERADAYHQVNLQFGVGMPQSGDCGGNQLIGKRLGCGHPNRASDERIVSCSDALKIERGGFHRCALTQNGLSGRSGGKAVRGVIEQYHAETLLEHCYTPPDRHL